MECLFADGQIVSDSKGMKIRIIRVTEDDQYIFEDLSTHKIKADYCHNIDACFGLERGYKSYCDSIKRHKVGDLREGRLVNTAKFKWKILDEKEAKKLHIQILKVNDNKTMLVADLAYMPKNVCVADYIDWIQETGIALNLTLPEK